MKYGFTRTVPLPCDRAVERVTEELKKLGLGACNPPLAHKALLTETDIGLLLPCNVIVYEKEGITVVGAFDPMTMVPLVDKPGLEPIAREVRQTLETALAAI